MKLFRSDRRTSEWNYKATHIFWAVANLWSVCQFQLRLWATDGYHNCVGDKTLPRSSHFDKRNVGNSISHIWLKTHYYWEKFQFLGGGGGLQGFPKLYSFSIIFLSKRYQMSFRGQYLRLLLLINLDSKTVSTLGCNLYSAWVEITSLESLLRGVVLFR